MNNYWLKRIHLNFCSVMKINYRTLDINSKDNNRQKIMMIYIYQFCINNL